MASRFSVEAVFKAIDNFSGVVGKIGGETKKMLKSVGASVDQLNGVADKAIGGLKAIGAAAIGVGLVASAGLMHIIHAGADFEHTITGVGAVMGKTRAQISDLEKEAMHLGVVTQFSATEVAEAMEMMARKGFDSGEILAGIPGVLNAVAASGESTAEVAQTVGSAIRGFGLDASKAGHVADVLAFSAEKTGARITEMGLALTNAAPTATALGVSIEDTAAAVGLMQKMGIDASTSGTAVATMLAKISKPSKDAQQQMTAMGIKFKDAKGNALPFIDILGQFSKAGKKAGGNMEKMGFFAELVGLRGNKAVLALSKMLETGDFQKLADGLKTVDGYAENVAKKRLDDTTGSWKLLTSTIEVLEKKLFDLESGPLRGVIDKTNAWFAANQDLIVQKVQDTIASIAAHMPQIVTWAERIGRAFAVFAYIAAVIKVASAAMAIFNFVVAADPIVLLVLALGAAVAAIIAFWPEISAFFSRVWKGIKDIAVRVGSAIASAAEAVWSSIKSFLSGALDIVVGLFATLFPEVIPAVKALFDALGEFATWLVSKWEPIKAFFVALWKPVGAAFAVAWKAIEGVAESVFARVKAIWEPIGAFFTNLWTGISDGFKHYLGWAVDKLESILNRLRDVGQNVLGGGDGQSHDAGGTGGTWDDATPPAPAPQVIPPSVSPAAGQEHAFYNTRESVDVNLIDRTSGRVQMPDRDPGSRVRLTTTRSGAFG